MASRPTSVPRWADGEDASIVEPAEAKKSKGWEAAEKPPAGYFNWLFRSIVGWLAWLSERTVSTGGAGSFGVTGLYSRPASGPAIDALAGGANSHGAMIAGRGTGNGINATGGETGGFGLFADGGVDALGFGARAAVVAKGGSVGGAGVEGTGTLAQPGVVGQGGPTNAPGVKGTGGGGGVGVVGVAGPTGAFGVTGTALGGAGVGVQGEGGQYGVVGKASGSSGNGAAVNGVGSGNRAGVRAESTGTGPALLLVPSALPTSPPQRGWVHLDSADGKLKYYNGSAWVVLG